MTSESNGFVDASADYLPCQSVGVYRSSDKIANEAQSKNVPRHSFRINVQFSFRFIIYFSTRTSSNGVKREKSKWSSRIRDALRRLVPHPHRVRSSLLKLSRDFTLQWRVLTTLRCFCVTLSTLFWAEVSYSNVNNSVSQQQTSRSSVERKIPKKNCKKTKRHISRWLAAFVCQNITNSHRNCAKIFWSLRQYCMTP